MKKKSQITIYVILGILLVFLIAVGAYYAANSARILVFSEQKEEAFSDVSQDTLNGAMDNCIRTFVFSSIDEFGFCDTESEYEQQILGNLSRCMNFDFYRAQNFHVIAKEKPDEVNVDINGDRISVNVKYPILMAKSDKRMRFEERTFTFPLDNSVSLQLDSDSRTTKDFVLISRDNDLELEIPKGTRVTSSKGVPEDISVKIMQVCPHNPGILGRVKYNFTPDELYFEPDAYITIKYEDTDIAKHASEERFKLAYLNGTYWEKIPSSADTERNLIKGSVSHLSQWAGICEGTNKYGIQIFLQDVVGMKDPTGELRDKYIETEIACASGFIGQCGFARIITYLNSGQKGQENFYKTMFDKMYEYQMIPVLSVKDMPPGGVEEVTWFHPGLCKGENDGSSFAPSFCKDLYLNSQWPGLCAGYSADCFYGENADGTSKPQYDYSDSAQRLKDLLNTVHADKPDWPMYIEIGNEPNLGYEWNGISLTDYEISEYARYFVEMARAIRSLGHSDSIRIMPAGLAPGLGATECALDPKIAKQVHERDGTSPPPCLDNIRVTSDPNFYSGFCEDLGQDVVVDNKNLCTPSFDEPDSDLCEDTCDPGDDECATDLEACNCGNSKRFSDYYEEWYNAYKSRSPGIFEGKSIQFTDDPCGDVHAAEDVRDIIKGTFGTNCYFKKVNIGSEEYLRKMFESPYGSQMCELTDYYADHPFPSIDNMQYPSGPYPYGAHAYQQRFEIAKSYCSKLAQNDCTMPDYGDNDGDTIIDIEDNCPNDANTGQEDWDKDSTGDACDDSDQDSVPDSEDICPMNASIMTGDDIHQQDGWQDSDKDGWAEICDNCPEIANHDQLDLNLNGIGDACEEDIDGDGIPNTGYDIACGPSETEACIDNCPYDSNPGQQDSDEDFVGDVCDNCPDKNNTGQEDWDKDSIGDACDDSDSDGFTDDIDYCPETPSSGNTKDICSAENLCEGRIFLTEVGWSYAERDRSESQRKYIESYTNEMDKAYDYYTNDPNVQGVTPFHLWIDDKNEWVHYSWVSDMCIDEFKEYGIACVGKEVYNVVGDIVDPPTSCTDVSQNTT
ncbi:thrombospondin type 3 repeat-containing protein [Candidatus Woesearchaeota archaeon]|nr:thrombospondin type 3 repeat-containing protein [Candidatus Woesearchaeota archaeon]